MKGHLSDNSSLAMTVVNPPPVQEMNAGQESSSSTRNGTEEVTTLEIQPL